MQKLYYSISEISELIDEEQHILRYWEKEFDQLNPKKNRGGNRIYSEKDLFLIRTIKKLLREDKLSLRGAKEQLAKIIMHAQEMQELSSHNNPKGMPDLQSYLNAQPAAEVPQGKIVSTEYLKDVYNLLKEIREFLK